MNQPVNSELRGRAACVFITATILMNIALSPGVLCAYAGTASIATGIDASTGYTEQTGTSQRFVTQPFRIRYTRSVQSSDTVFPDFYSGRQDPSSVFSHRLTLLDDTEESPRDTVPTPSSVMRKSMIIPGWGQVVNRQIWKVPVIYGLLAGLTYYSIQMDQNYRDYRAAFYNSQNPDGDQRFGPTPPHIDPNQNPESMRYNRNVYRNRRDLTIIGVVLAYGLNIVDAYVFAQMRDFDVSDDLSAGFYLGPANLPGNSIQKATLAPGPGPERNRFSASKSMDGLVLTLQIALR
ncbi:MAG: hypothetical protein EA363_11645 [Balneolaceae bacterium]|nr:MAG: hypothetical protein EA363_11645 [Balneolaceae bacterium]